MKKHNPSAHKRGLALLWAQHGLHKQSHFLELKFPKWASLNKDRCSPDVSWTFEHRSCLPCPQSPWLTCWWLNSPWNMKCNYHYRVFMQNGSFQALSLWFLFQLVCPFPSALPGCEPSRVTGSSLGPADLTHPCNSIAKLQWSAVISRIYFSFLIIHLLWKELKLIFHSLGNKDAVFLL